MSSVDAAWLGMEDPTNLMMVTGVLALDGNIDLKRLRALLDKRLAPFGRFHQRVVRPRLRAGILHWQDDPHFDIGNHVSHIALPTPGGDKALRDLVSELMSTALDTTKPLWHVHLIDGHDRGSVVLARIHHSIADGIALVRVMLSLTDPSPTAAPPRRRSNHADDAGPIDWLPAAIGRGVAAGQHLLDNPSRIADVALLSAQGAYRLGRLIVLPPDPATAFKGRLGRRKRAAWSTPIPLEDFKAIGTAFGATVNDVLVATATGALRRYLERRGEPTVGLSIRASVPVNLRAGGRRAQTWQLFRARVSDAAGRRRRPCQAPGVDQESHGRAQTIARGPGRLRRPQRDGPGAGRGRADGPALLRQQGDRCAHQRPRPPRAALPGRAPAGQGHVLGPPVGAPRPRHQHPELRGWGDARGGHRRGPGRRSRTDRGGLRPRVRLPADSSPAKARSNSDQGPCLTWLQVGNLVSTMAEATAEQEALDAYSTIVTSVAEAVLPSVASLRIGRGGRGFGGAGSGVVITPDGFLVTSAHVVAAGGTASASFIDGTEHDVDVVGADPLSDLAVARARADGLQPARVGNADQLRVGQLVVAIGNPMGFSGSVTSGVVSGLGRSLATADGNGNRRFIEDVIQTDAALNPGNSGGELADSHARLIGVNTAVAGMGLGLAVPMN